MINLFDPKNNRGTMSAKVKFEPPPSRKFWSHGVDVEHPAYPHGLSLSAYADDTTDGPSANDAAHNHPGNVNIPLGSLGFGCMVKPTVMHVMKSVRSEQNSRLQLDKKRKIINIFFSYSTEPTKSNYWATSREFKAVIRISTIEKILEANDDEWQHLVVVLPHPPEYFRKCETISDTFQDNPQRWSADRTWYRATNIRVQDENPQTCPPVALHDDMENDSHINIGRWTTFRLSFDVRQHAGNNSPYKVIQSTLSEFNIFSHPNCEFDEGKAVSAWEYLDHPSTGGQQPSTLLGLRPIVHLESNVRYQLEVCISRGLLSEYTISFDFLRRLATLSPSDATRRLEYIADEKQRMIEPMDLFEIEDAEFYVSNARLPYFCAYVRRASITPTTILLSSPTVEMSNRVLRKYSHLQDRFLRVQFIGESEFGRIHAHNQQNDDIWKRVRRTLFQGVRIGSRVYEFLAFGSSQLRECGVYFFCPTDHVSCDDIRAWMGDFDHIKIVAKYAARLGQCFSTTREIRGTGKPQVKYIPDVERNGHCFTDGVGLISKFFAQAITQDMTLDVLSEPTAFQFRMGGSKGMLAVWPQIKWQEVHIRNSQEKFKSKSKGLEVVRCASRATATLNRQTITILESLGVPRSAFLKLLREQIKSFENAAQSSSAAVELLTKFVDANQNTLVLAELLKAGFKTAEEPFTANLLKLWISWSFKLLKEKARIHVTQSAFVLGCVDETGTLQGHFRETEGSVSKNVDRLPQIFLQLTDPDRYNQKTVVTGVCIVGRNPSLHPGDIRVVHAVDEPRLRHLTDVVVFPSTGDRPVPSMLSGGDLDGDDFFIIWDGDLIPREWNYPPMDYKGPNPQKLDRDVAVDDLRDFFVNYMKNDVLALIAVSHLAFADEFGPKSQLCLHLADQHSRAVDYPKTGEPADFDPKEQPRRWPHFMERKSTYHSKKALGAIYDEVAKHSTNFDPSWEHAFDKRITERFEIEEDTLEAAKVIKTQYDISVRRLLAQYEVKTEFELYTSWCMSRPRIGSDFKRQESLGHEYDAVKQRFRDQCYNMLDGNEPEQLDKFVAAMYKVTEEDVKAARKDEEELANNDLSNGISGGSEPVVPVMPLISFPWIFHWVMIRLAMGENYKPGKAVLAAARRIPAVNHKIQSLFGNFKSPRSRADVGAVVEKASLESKEGPMTKEDNPRGGNAIREVAENIAHIDDVTEGGPDSVESSNVSLAGEAAIDRLTALLGIVE